MHHGVVKWFKTVKGYGFIAGDDGKEIFVHHSDILMNGFRNLEVGQRVMIIPGLSEPPVRTLRATIPENESHILR